MTESRNTKPVLSDYIDLEKLRNGVEIADLAQMYDESRACPDCGDYIGRYYGPIDFDGQRHQDGDWICRECARARGVEVHG